MSSPLLTPLMPVHESPAREPPTREPPASTPAAGAPAAGPPLARRVPATRRQGRRWGRWALALLGLGIVAALVWALLPQPVPVDLVRVARGPLEVTVSEDGRTRLRDRFEVAAPVAGTLLRITARAGDSVRQGDALARIVPLAAPLLDARSRAEAEARVAAAAAAVAQAHTAVRRAQDAYALAARDAERQRHLAAAGATAAQALEQAEVLARARGEELAAARSGVTVAEAQLAMQRASLARLLGRGPAGAGEIVLRAPTDGVVLAVPRESEGPVQPGQPVVAIGDPRALEVVVDLLTPDAARVRPGAPVRLERWGGADTLHGHVRRVEPTAFTKLSALGVEEQRVNVLVDLDDPYARRAGLGDGYRVEASILVWAAPDVLTVPASAPFRHGDGWAVYRFEDGRARLVPIRVGERTDALVAVLQGLRPGDRVVAYPGEQVHAGVRVAPR
ncbi:MAG TPA: HlyD family efflux transporter periplasmic adaptor subunit [Gemmatimonadales bacterium]|nr:HlyD family efflux transporter periplasmic adaptor subunit [Gemmatimonadales bacterium]